MQSPSWRPDSRALVFTSNMFERDEYVYERADIFTVELEGAVRRVTDDGFDHGAAIWAADGSIVAVREQSLNQILAARQAFGSPTDLYRFPAGGGTPVNLTASWDYIPGTPRIAPEGRVLQFTAGVAGSTHLFRVPLTGGAVEQVTRGNRRLADASIAWDVQRVAYVAGDATQPAEVHVAALDGSGERRLSQFNDALLAAIRPRPAEPVRFTSKDGAAVEGWVILPASADPSARVPLILAIHGGPHGAYGNDFSVQFQVWAANGYAVLYTNPRGSTEYGEKHLWDTWGGWGGRDYEDVMAGVDYVVARYPVDPKRLGVTGYSYGGFLTNWVITQTTRFSGGDRRRGNLQLGERLRHRRHPAHQGERVRRHAVGGEGRRGAAQVVAGDARGVGHDPDALRARRGRPARADRAGRADVHGTEEAEGAGEVHPLPRQLPHRVVAVEHRAPLPAGAGVVAGAPAGVGVVRARAALTAATASVGAGYLAVRPDR